MYKTATAGVQCQQQPNHHSSHKHEYANKAVYVLGGGSELNVCRHRPIKIEDLESATPAAHFVVISLHYFPHSPFFLLLLRSVFCLLCVLQINTNTAIHFNRHLRIATASLSTIVVVFAVVILPMEMRTRKSTTIERDDNERRNQ